MRKEASEKEFERAISADRYVGKVGRSLVEYRLVKRRNTHMQEACWESSNNCDENF